MKMKKYTILHFVTLGIILNLSFLDALNMVDTLISKMEGWNPFMGIIPSIVFAIISVTFFIILSVKTLIDVIKKKNASIKTIILGLVFIGIYNILTIIYTYIYNYFYYTKLEIFEANLTFNIIYISIDYFIMLLNGIIRLVAPIAAVIFYKKDNSDMKNSDVTNLITLGMLGISFVCFPINLLSIINIILNKDYPVISFLPSTILPLTTAIFFIVLAIMTLRSSISKDYNTKKKTLSFGIVFVSIIIFIDFILLIVNVVETINNINDVPYEYMITRYLRTMLRDIASYLLHSILRLISPIAAIMFFKKENKTIKVNE